MLSFAPCFAGLYARTAAIGEADRAKLTHQLAKVAGWIKPIMLRSRRAYGLIADQGTPCASLGGSHWIHPERNGFALIDGAVHNRLELISLLGSSGPDTPDAELVFAAYRRWGAACMEKLLGDLVIALYDEAQGFLCAMDPSGERPFFFAEGDGLFRWATHPLLLADERAVRCDRAYFRDYLSLEPCDRTRTPYVGIRRLRPGYTVHVDGGGMVKEFRWWDPPSRGSIRYAKRADYAHRLRGLLTEATRCRLEHHERVGILLSGGIDSGAVTVCASELIRQGRVAIRELTAFTVSSPEYPRSDESSFAAEIAARIGVTHRRIPPPKVPDMRELARIAAGIPYPSGHILIAPWINEVARVMRESGVTLVLSGAAGEIFLGDPSCLSQLLTERKLLSFVKGLAQLRYHGIPLAQIIKPVLLDLREASLRAPFAAKRQGDEKSSAAVLPPDIPTTKVSTDPITRDLDRTITEAERIDRWDMAVFRPAGVLSKAPFLDRRLLEFAFAIPFELNIPIRQGDVPKPLLREAFPEVPCDLSRQAHGVALEDLASAQWGESTQIDALNTMLKNMDSVFDEVLDRSQLVSQLHTIRRPDCVNDIAEALAVAIWANALRSSAVEQFV